LKLRKRQNAKNELELGTASLVELLPRKEALQFKISGICARDRSRFYVDPVLIRLPLKPSNVIRGKELLNLNSVQVHNLSFKLSLKAIFTF